MRRPRVSMAGAALVATAIALGAQTSGALERLEADTLDQRFELRGADEPSDVVVVGIDDRTFDELDRRWPFPRSLHGKVIDRLRRAGARVVTYDIQFTEPTRPREDDALIGAVERAAPVVLSTTEVDRQGRSNVFGGEAVLRAIGARAGNTNVSQDADGVVRRVRPVVDGLASFPVAAVEVATRRAVAPSSFPADGELVDFLGPPGTVPELSFSRVLRGRFDAELVRGRVVVVGATAPSLNDIQDTATSGDEVMSGPELMAQSISSLLRGSPLSEAPGWLDVLLVVLLACVTPLAALRLSPAHGALVAAGAFALLLGGAVLAFASGLVVSVVAPALALALASFAALGLRLSGEMRERRRTRELFGRFVPTEVVEELLQLSESGRRLPGTARDATVMFTDLRGFTTFAESQPPELVLDVLNRYLGDMSEAILAHKGTVVSYMGDGIMAVFGSPVARPDHADAALAAAREMLELRIPRFSAWLSERGLPEFRMGVGLNSGTVMSGTVGSDERLEYAAIGDTTNVAARLEAMTKGTDGGLLVAESTRSRLSVGAEDLLPAGELALRGRAEAVATWTLPVGGDGRPREMHLASA